MVETAFTKKTRDVQHAHTFTYEESCSIQSVWVTVRVQSWSFLHGRFFTYGRVSFHSNNSWIHIFILCSFWLGITFVFKYTHIVLVLQIHIYSVYGYPFHPHFSSMSLCFFVCLSVSVSVCVCVYISTIALCSSFHVYTCLIIVTRRLLVCNVATFYTVIKAVTHVAFVGGGSTMKNIHLHIYLYVSIGVSLSLPVSGPQSLFFRWKIDLYFSISLEKINAVN